MSTENNPNSDELDSLEEEYLEVPDERRTVGRGPEVLREQLRKAAQRKQQVTIRLDADIVERFKQLAGEDGSYQSLINRALHDWLEAQSVGGLLRGEIEELAELVRALKSEGGDRLPSI
jgi:uncharacterized protein (DUF4415 family)